MNEAVRTDDKRIQKARRRRTEWDDVLSRIKEIERRLQEADRRVDDIVAWANRHCCE